MPQYGEVAALADRAGATAASMPPRSTARAAITRLRLIVTSGSGSVPGAPPVAGSTGAQFAKELEAAMAAPQPKWTSPVPGAQVTSTFGPRWGTMHEGIDLAANVGTPVAAAASGTVRTASWYGGYGNAVII